MKLTAVGFSEWSKTCSRGHSLERRRTWFCRGRGRKVPLEERAMDGLGSHDGDKVIDWGKTSEDYSVHRPGPPPSFFARLAALGIGREGQRILDLGTGTGVMARQFARQ